MLRVPLRFLLPVALVLLTTHVPADAGELDETGIAGLVLGTSWIEGANNIVHSVRCVPASAGKGTYINPPDRKCFVTFAAQNTLFGEKLLPDARILLKDGKLLAISIRVDIGPSTPAVRRAAWLRSFSRYADMALHAGEREFLLTNAHALAKEGGVQLLAPSPAVLLRATPGEPTMDLIWGAFEIVLGVDKNDDI